MNTPGRWRIGALASAIALLGSLASLEAHALALGRITVQSALGEPLRAEIDIADINAQEAASLRAGVASPDAFKAAGLEYSNVASTVEVRLQRRPDGRAYLRLSSNRPVSEPFVDLILEANWSSGRLTRDYTMLFDPPNLRADNAAAAPAPTAPVLSRPAAPVAAAQPPAPAAPSAPYSQPAPRPAAAQPAPPAVRPLPAAPAPAPVAVARPAAAASPAPAPAKTGAQVVVRAGDTAGKIAAQNKPATVSLDQMLVALLRSNPDAFIGGNVNRVKSGAVLDMPSAEAASAISAGEASRTIVAQSKDFNVFRRKLAESAPTTQVAGANRAAGGKVQANVEDRASASATPDKLTLSKGSVQGKASAAEEKIAKDRQARDDAARVAELSKNISDLNKLGVTASTAAGTTSAAGAAAAASAAKTAGVAVPTPSALPASPTPAVQAASASAAASPANSAASAAIPTPAAVAASAAVAEATPASAATSATPAASAPAVTASAPAADVAKPKAPAAPAPAPEPSLIDELLDNPLILPLFGGLLLLLGGFGYYRYRQRNNPSQVDSSFLESRLQPDSFFGASGGQRIDTNEGNVTGSSLVYSPSQLDAAGDVDPVAEADVYLAYGRDLQAEEILKEAMRTSPMRVAIHAKLLEIYAKRRDSKAFELVAVEAFNLTHGNGPEWAYITEMGRELDPENDMYQPGGQPVSAAGALMGAAAVAAFDPLATTPVPVAPAAIAPLPMTLDFDLDLDFSSNDEPLIATMPAPASAAPAPAPTSAPVARPAGAPAASIHDLDMDFDISTVAMQNAAPRAAPSAPVADSGFGADDFNTGSMNFSAEPFLPAGKAPPAPAPVADSGMLEFDLSSLSLDLEPVSTLPPIQAPAVPGADDPLETKFLLAEEFRALGDAAGARSLAEEVLAKAGGPLKVKAQAFLNALS